jgi:hypothetical protein
MDDGQHESWINLIVNIIINKYHIIDLLSQVHISLYTIYYV